jgi:chromosome segregation ATPase
MATTTDLQPIDRLEEKVKQLVGMIETLRADRTKALDSAARLERDLDAAAARIAELETNTVEATTLREEREKIRLRVVEIISHIDMLNL